MKRNELHIPEPCEADWDAMTGDDRKRFCLSCTKHVHNLSEMDRDDATHLLASTPNLCVQYASDKSGEVFFKDSNNPTWRLHRQIEGTKRLLAAALVIPMLAACDAPDQSSSAVSPVILINPDGTIKAPGAGLVPTFDPTMIAQPVSPPDEPMEMLQGELEAPPDIELLQGEPEELPVEEVEHKMGKMAVEPRPAKPEVIPIKDIEPDVHLLKGDVAYVPSEPADDASTTDEPSCEPDSDKNTSPTHDTTGQTGTPPEDTPHILRGRVAPRHK